MDAIDRKLLVEVARDSSRSSEELGSCVGLSSSATHRRLKILEESGMILGYAAKLSRAARGNPSVIFIFVTLADQRRETMEQFEAAVAAQSPVKEAHLTSGDADYILKIEIPENDSFERMHREMLADLPGVQRLVSNFSIRSVVGGGA